MMKHGILAGAATLLLCMWTATAFDLQTGWPVVIGNDIVTGPLVVADLDGDGTQEVVVTSSGTFVPNSGFVYVFAADGSDFGPFPLDVGDRAGYAALADLDEDGQLDIVTAVEGETFELMALRHSDGAPLPGWPIVTDGGRPTIADVNDDGTCDVLISTIDRVRVFSADGTHLVDLVTGYACEGMQAVGDADGDRDLEILIGSAHGGVFLFDHAGNLLPGWPNDSDRFPAPVTMADLDDDGVMEMIAKDQNYTLFAWQLDGTLLFSQNVHADLYREVVPHDLDGDGDRELLFIADFGSNSGVDARHHDGAAVAGWPQMMAGFPSSGGSYNGEPGATVVDIDGDQIPEILATSRAGDFFYVYAWEADGSSLTGFPITIEPDHGVAPNGSGQIAVTDLDGDGDVEILWMAYQQSLGQQIWRTIIYAWDLPGDWNAAASPWPQFHQGPDHRGSLEVRDPASVDGDPIGGQGGPLAEQRGGLSLRAFPNPYYGRTTGRLLFVSPDAFGQSTGSSLDTPTLDLLDVHGRLIRRLTAGAGGTGSSGHVLFTWDGTDRAGRPCPTGTYTYRLASASNGVTHRSAHGATHGAHGVARTAASGRVTLMR